MAKDENEMNTRGIFVRAGAGEVRQDLQDLQD